MDWSNEVTLEFLALYEKEPLLWNPKDPLHKNRNAVNDAWNRIRDHISIECSVAVMKKKKDSLMATFRPLSHKVKESMRTGSGTNDVYKPNWFFYEHMAKFLHSIYQPKATINTEELDETLNIGETNTEDEILEVESPSSGIIFKSPSAKVTKKRKNTNVVEDCMLNAYNVMKSVCEKPPKDDCSVYAELLARKLRAFDEPTREVLMHDIDELIFQTKRGTLNRATQSYLSPIQIRQNYQPVYNMSPHNFNNVTSQLYSNSPPFLSTSPASSSSLSSENVYNNQSSPNLNPTNLSYQASTNLSYEAPETCFETQSTIVQNEVTDNQFL